MHPEQQYLDLIRRVMDEGFYRVSPWEPLPSQPAPPGTYSLINQNMAFDLTTGELPLMTVRKIGLKPILAELLWFLSGSTNNNDLVKLGAHIWDPWATDETAGSMGYKYGELGPIYGAQWRNFGARTILADGTVHHGRGFDQITALVEEIKTRPHSKRMMVTSWHPADMERCFVATCHGIFHCSVEGDLLNLHMFQRSGDVPVGIPFNIASYSLLVMMLAQVTALQPGRFYHTISDAHVYEHQLPAMKQLLERDPMPYPSVRLNPDIDNIFDFGMEDFELVGYQSHPKLEVPVAT